MDSRDDLLARRCFEDLMQVVLGIQKRPHLTETKLYLPQNAAVAAMVKAGR